MNIAAQGKDYKPKDKLTLSVRTKSENEKSLVALAAVDMALYNFRANDKNPLNKVNMCTCIYVLLKETGFDHLHRNTYEGHLHASYGWWMLHYDSGADEML